MPSPALLLRRLRPSLAVGLALALVASLVALVGTSAGPARALGYSATVDALSSYEPQTTCTTAPQPGTAALAQWLVRTYKATGSMGMMRGCKVGGTSEHKDGRAFDWAADVRKKKQRKQAYRFINAALAPDAAGNTHALARRMGIMYLIYNDTIWSSYRDFAPRPYLNAACKRLKKCSRTLRHKNHVHISLGYAGAAAQTSWYRERNVPSAPVLHPGTDEIDADETALTAFTVPATGAVVSSPFFLRAGVTYRLVATGAVLPAPAPAAGDANCVTTDGSAYALAARGPVVAPPAPTRTAWQRDHEGSDHAESAYALPTPDTSGLLVNGALRWEGGCQPGHVYEAWFTPATRQRLDLRYLDPTPADAAGALTVYLARDDITAASLGG